MERNNIKDIQKAFGEQAQGFDAGNYHLSKSEYQEYMIKKTEPQSSDHLLEVAAGTCICGRAYASHVNHVTCLDATPAMLKVGKKEAEDAGISNITFVKGIAEELPFLDNSFDIVISRLAFHHFVNPEEIFTEMKRVLKPGGKLVLMDMVPQKEELRAQIDEMEQMRDFSHVKELTTTEMRNLYEKKGMKLLTQECIKVPVSVEAWMELTHTPEETKEILREKIKSDIEGRTDTGFQPYMKEDNMYFDHHWMFNLGIK